MSDDSITYPVYPQNQNYAQPSDVLDLLGAITFTTSASSNATITKFLTRGTRYLETMTGRKFGPTRWIEEYDGSGKASLALQNYPVISVNVVRNYISPVILNREQHDYSLIIDRETGIVRTPPTLITNQAAQFYYVFYKGNKNVQADYWSGFTYEVTGEQLTTSDNQTFSSANGNFAKTFLQHFGPVVANPPVYRPIVYVNGTQLVNTTYTFNSQSIGEYFTINEDNIYYTVDYATGKITFNQAQDPSAVITADYSYWYIPEDIQDACAKYAAIQVLKAEGVGLGGAEGQGAALRQIQSIKVQYGRNTTLPWEAHVDGWKADIQAVIDRYMRVSPMMKNGFVSGSGPNTGW